MTSRSETPDELATWVDARVRMLAERVEFMKDAARIHREDAPSYAKHVTSAAAEIRRTAYELEYLMSVYALSEELVGATEISRAAQVTPASMYHRLTTKLAKTLMGMVFGKGRQLRLPQND